MTTGHEPGLTPTILLQILIRQRKKVIATSLLLAAAVVAVAMLLPPSFHSEARLFVRIGRESVSLDPTATTSQTISIYESRENEINSILEILKSRELAQHVVDRVGAAKILGQADAALAAAKGKSFWLGDAASNLLGVVRGAAKSVTGALDVPLREQAVESLEKRVTVFAAKRSSVLTLDCQAKTPELAQEIAMAFLEEYSNQHQKVNSINGSYRFFETQTDLLETELTSARDIICQTKNKYGMISISGQRQLQEKQLLQVEIAILTNNQELAASRAKLTSMQEALKGLPERVLTLQVAGFANAAADTMRETLYKLEIRERELRSKYAEGHPEVMAITQQVAESQKILNRQTSDRTQSTQTTNPAWNALRLQLLIAEPRVAYLEAEAAALLAQRANLGEALRLFNRREVEVEELERHAALLEASYTIHRQKLEEARIQQAMENDRITNVNIVQSPTINRKPVGPKRRLLALCGFVAAVLSGVGVALATEFFGDATTQQRVPTPVGPHEVGAASERLARLPAGAPRHGMTEELSC